MRKENRKKKKKRDSPSNRAGGGILAHMACGRGRALQPKRPSSEGTAAGTAP